ncbi:MAG: hypothetical protein CO093_10115, partial [Alphaproteobacteria bacterium CG_4_9_14_3_um_filter_47_13]
MDVNVQKANQKIIVHVPINLRKWGGKKVVVGPVGQDLRRLDLHIRKDEKLLKALGRAYKWQTWIETGKCNNAQEISEIENINRGGPTLLDRLAAFLRWNPVSTIMPPLR